MHKEMFNSVITTGQNAIKSVLLINIVLLVVAIPKESPAALFFTLGTATATLTFGGTYLAQLLFAFELDKRSDGEESTRFARWGYLLQFSCILLWLTSFVSFCVGGWNFS